MLSAADWHADGASIVYRYFYETWQLHIAAAEARYAALGLFRNNPDAFPGGRKRWAETFDQFFTDVKAYKPPLFFEEWPRVRAVIEEFCISATPESLANDSFHLSAAAKFEESVNSILREDRALAEAYKVLTPAHLRKICEHARERLLTIGQYERENIQAAKTGAPGFPVLSGRYSPQGLLTVIWALADRVGKGWPEVPLHEFNADEAFRLLGGLMRWCDQRQAELDQAPGLLGVWPPSLDPAKMPIAGVGVETSPSAQASAAIGFGDKTNDEAGGDDTGADIQEPPSTVNCEGDDLPRTVNKPCLSNSTAPASGIPPAQMRLTVTDAARYVGVTEPTMRSWIKNGDIKCESVGRTLYAFDKVELDIRRSAKAMRPNGGKHRIKIKPSGTVESETNLSPG